MHLSLISQSLHPPFSTPHTPLFRPVREKNMRHSSMPGGRLSIPEQSFGPDMQKLSLPQLLLWHILPSLFPVFIG